MRECENQCDEINMQLDRVSDVTLITRGMWQKIGSPLVSPTSISIRDAWGEIPNSKLSQYSIVGVIFKVVTFKI